MTDRSKLCNCEKILNSDSLVTRKNDFSATWWIVRWGLDADISFFITGEGSKPIQWIIEKNKYLGECGFCKKLVFTFKEVKKFNLINKYSKNKDKKAKDFVKHLLKIS